ncbi:putative glutamine amidotransferase [Ancylomarina subtilis]|uniref:Putative glutamine amidotransferase n=1 Tax=Ancylomarina subtilis TaxID=1639035 RepID=A0A4Q7VIA1_9BACT|nr:gamma-glutamyl-gamma-aminobutyrate hydrolase family protein [Ancylomarina subtilis]RZT95843.1 putative glutamine amidotransferase [Ancylomarina subtilis]
MKFKLLLILLLPVSLLQAQLLKPLPDHLNKRILIAHPTAGNINILSTLSNKGLLDLDSIQLVGLYHSKEEYDYAESQAVLDTLKAFNMYLVELNDSLYADSLFQKNELTDKFYELFTHSVASFFFGGPDIPAALYHEEQNPLTKVYDPYRHYFELSFIYHLLGGRQNHQPKAFLKQKPDYLVHGICLGMQSMNVATGGSLIQDIPSEVYHGNESEGLDQLGENEIHRNYYNHMPENEKRGLSGFHFHHIRFKGNTFTKLTGIQKKACPMVNSYHHQAIKKLGKGFRISARSMDGKIIEAISHKTYPNVWGIQFHPERTDFYNPKNKVRFTPKGEAKTFADWLDHESMSFHKAYWKAINERLRKL